MSILPNDNLSSQANPEKPKKSWLRKFIFKSFKPVPSVKSTVLILLFLGISYIIIGSILIATSSDLQEYKTDQPFNPCPLVGQKDPSLNFTQTITLSKNMSQPIMVYFYIDNFYQNHRIYSKSISYKQLMGKAISESEAKVSCSLAYFNQDIPSARIFFNNTSLENVAYPCGIIAKTYPDFSFSLYRVGQTTEIPINQTGISWEYDKNHRFRNVSNKSYWTDVTNEHFVVWMKTGAMGSSKKLFGRIERDLQAGSYNVQVSVSAACPFNSTVNIVLANVNVFGGNNLNLGIVYVVIGSVTIIAAICFVIKRQFFNKSNYFH